MAGKRQEKQASGEQSSRLGHRDQFAAVEKLASTKAADACAAEELNRPHLRRRQIVGAIPKN